MAGLVKPRSYPIRKITEGAQKIGRIFQQRRYPNHGGFDGPGAWGSSSEFPVTKPTSIRTAESNGGKYADD